MGLPEMEKWWDWDQRELGILAETALSADGPPSGAVRFPDLIRRQISESFRREWAKAHDGHPSSGAEERFIENLEWYAEKYADVPWITGSGGLNAQASREKLEAVANALESLAAALDKAPEIECWMIAITELARRGYSVPLALAILPLPLPCNWPLQEAAMPTVSALSDAFRSGLSNREAPRRKGKRHFEALLAERIVRTLDAAGMKASTSSTGLAGLAFESTCELAGKGSIRASHWLREAVESWQQSVIDHAAFVLIAEKTHAVQRDLLAMLKRHT